MEIYDYCGEKKRKLMSFTAIILTFNEEQHVVRCIKSLNSVAGYMVVLDSFSADQTIVNARALGASVIQRPWKNYADQFQWALDTLNVETPWIMRMDADEYLEPELQSEILEILPTVPDDVDGIYIKRKVFFQGQWIRHGGFYPQTLLRIWRAGKGRIEQRWMDEHIVLQPGAKTITLKGHLVDDNLKGMTFWINKHNGYASREAVDLLNHKYPLFQQDDSIKKNDDPQAKWKRIVKEQIYSKLPAGLRAFLYFIYRYFFLLGFLDGKKGFIWHFMQGFWYRLLVDVKIMEIEERAQGDVEKIRQILRDEHGISL